MDFLLPSKRISSSTPVKREEGTKKERQRQGQNHANIQGQRSQVGNSGAK